MQIISMCPEKETIQLYTFSFMLLNIIQGSICSIFLLKQTFNILSYLKRTKHTSLEDIIINRDRVIDFYFFFIYKNSRKVHRYFSRQKLK
jgi:hypothetical protein